MLAKRFHVVLRRTAKPTPDGQSLYAIQECEERGGMGGYAITVVTPKRANVANICSLGQQH